MCECGAKGCVGLRGRHGVVQCYVGPGWVVPPCEEMGALGGGPVPSTLSREPVPGKPWDAQWRALEGRE